MPAKLTLHYEVDYDDIPDQSGHTSRFTVIREFPSHEVTTTDILDAYEALLRSAGFHCPHESLDIVDESHN